MWLAVSLCISTTGQNFALLFTSLLLLMHPDYGFDQHFGVVVHFFPSLSTDITTTTTRKRGQEKNWDSLIPAHSLFVANGIDRAAARLSLSIAESLIKSKFKAVSLLSLAQIFKYLPCLFSLFKVSFAQRDSKSFSASQCSTLASNIYECVCVFSLVKQSHW